MNSIIKLTNGETIIAEVVHQDENTICVLDPLALEVGESETGRPMMVAITWVPLIKKVNMVNLKSNHVVAIAECDEYLDEYYNKSLSVLRADVDKSSGGDIDIEYEEYEEGYMEEKEKNPWMEKFGTPVITTENQLSANTVH
jgi:hypothetical protein